ncbi:MAG: hypothetical protein ACK4N5_04465, partial [Myxococcales bacterium]
GECGAVCVDLAARAEWSVERAIEGEIVAVSPEENRVTVRDVRTGDDVTLELIQESQVVLPTGQAQLSALEEGQQVRAGFVPTAERAVATRIEVTRESELAGAGTRDTEQISGQVTELSPFLDTVVVQTPDGASMTLQIAPRTRALLDGNEVEIGAVAEGSEVRASYRVRDEGLPVAERIEVLTPPAPGDDGTAGPERLPEPFEDAQEP